MGSHKLWTINYMCKLVYSQWSDIMPRMMLVSSRRTKNLSGFLALNLGKYYDHPAKTALYESKMIGVMVEINLYV